VYIRVVEGTSMQLHYRLCFDEHLIQKLVNETADSVENLLTIYRCYIATLYFITGRPGCFVRFEVSWRDERL
jgi:hypothetical protein